MIYAIDFDGTLCEEMWPVEGKPKTEMIEHCKRLREQGHKLILWTCREGELLDRAVIWCAYHGLCFDAVNENLPERVQQYGGDCRKISADFYYDDKNKFDWRMLI